MFTDPSNKPHQTIQINGSSHKAVVTDLHFRLTSFTVMGRYRCHFTERLQRPRHVGIYCIVSRSQKSWQIAAQTRSRSKLFIVITISVAMCFGKLSPMLYSCLSFKTAVTAALIYNYYNFHTWTQAATPLPSVDDSIDRLKSFKRPSVEWALYAAGVQGVQVYLKAYT